MRPLTITAGIFLAGTIWLLQNDPGPLEPKEFAVALQAQPQAQLIDLRSPEDFSGGHIPGAMSIDRNRRAFTWRIAELDTACPVFLYSGDGARDAQTEAYLNAKGFVSVTSLRGGFASWRREKLTTTPAELIPPAELNSEQFCRLLELEHLVVVDFYVPWEKNCRQLEPVLDEIAVDYRRKLKILRINIDTYKYLAAEIGIDTVPTLHFYENGNLCGTLEGVNGRERIEGELALREYAAMAYAKK